MTPSEFEVAQGLFLELRTLDSAQCDSRLAKLSYSHSPEIVQFVSSLLKADSGEDSFLETPCVSKLPITESQLVIPGEERHSETTSQFQPSQPDPTFPKQVGPYRILQKIGEGGHGMVFMAEQLQPIRRKVALKLIKPGMESAQILARFEAERQALAMMHHPSIANVIDAGTSEAGSPYFVMELVHGVSIDRFCADNKLVLREILEIFTQVCEAVHHAHRKGIIHRDIKPANVLVTVESGKPLAKVIDFGIAKAMHLSLTDRTLFTEYGQIVGTLEYMSPEQAMMSQDEADVRTDVYSLGVLLYQLLTGTTPISKEELLRKGIWELKTVLQETNPQTPSVRFTNQVAAKSWRDRTAIQKKSWLQSLSGDLDWITMKALAKEPNQRYDSVSALTHDLNNYLLGEQVSARPPSLAYVTSKLLRKHRIAALVGACLLVSLMIALLSISWGLIKATQNLTDARVAKELVSEKAAALEQALAATQREQIRADEYAKRMAVKLKREILESSWESVLDGDVDEAMKGLKDIAPEHRGYAWRFVRSVGQQMDWPSLRSDQDGPLRAIATHPTLGLLAAITTDSQLEIWDLERRERVQRIQLENSLYSCLAFSADGKDVLVGSSDWVNAINLSQQTITPLIRHGRGGTRKIVHGANRGEWLITTGANYLIEVDTDKSAIERSVKLPERVAQLSLSPDQSWATVSGLSGRVFAVSMADFDSTVTLTGSSIQVIDYRWKDKELYAANTLCGLYKTSLESLGSGNSVVKMEQVIAPERTFRSGKNASCVAITAEAQLVAADNNGQVSIVPDALSEIPIRNFSPAITQISHLSGPKVVCIQHFNGRVNLISDQDVQCRRNYVGHLDDLSDGMAFTTQARSLTSHLDGAIRTWDTRTGEILSTTQAHSSEVLSIAVDEGRNRIVSVGADWKLRFANLADQETLHVRDVGLGVRATAINRLGNLVASAPDRSNSVDLREGTLDLWEVESASPLRRLTGHTNWVIQAEFSSDDSRLFTLALDGTFKTWAVESGKCVLTIDLSTGAPTKTFCVLEASEQVALGHEDGSLSLRSLRDGSVLATKSLLANSIGSVLCPRESDCLLVASESEDIITCVAQSDLSVIAKLNAGTGNIVGMRHDAQSKKIQIVGDGGAVRIWNLPAEAEKEAVGD